MEVLVLNMDAQPQFVLSLDTDKRINDAIFARSFLLSWLNHPLMELRPERWGRGEPVRSKFPSINLDRLVSEWCSAALMFSRISPPKMTVSLNWRERKGLDPRSFPWGVDAWIAQNTGARCARVFLEFLITNFKPAFASLTTVDDSRDKHFLKEPHFVNGRQVGMAERFEGHHVLDTLPGVYWMTYFGSPAIARIGEERLKTLPVGRLERLGGGYLVLPYDDPTIIGTEEGRAIERRIVNHLGPGRFFDKKAAAVKKGGPIRLDAH